MKRFLLMVCSIWTLTVQSNLLAQGQQVLLPRAEGETLSIAVGHFARSRSLLIEAIREFDRGYKIADPSALIDSGEWRKSLVGRAEELERVLDPQPRVSHYGIKYQADTRLLNDNADLSAAPDSEGSAAASANDQPSGPQDGNTAAVQELVGESAAEVAQQSPNEAAVNLDQQTTGE